MIEQPLVPARSPTVQVAVLTFDGFNELDSFVATDAMRYVAPVGEKDAYVERALAVVRGFLPAEPAPA